jgi:tetratricopeptide (TPR) repeat protein
MDRQQQILHDLQEAVRRTPTYQRSQAENQLVRLPTGDGMALVFFHDPEAPVHCALELTNAVRPFPEIKLRMGIHTGPVYRVADINENRNVTGGGINIAQRVMDCGEVGHILVSAASAEVLGQVSAWGAMLHDLAVVEVKHGLRLHLYNLYAENLGNPALPTKLKAQQPTGTLSSSKTGKVSFIVSLVAFALAVAAGATWLLRAGKTHALTDVDTIVVADFANRTNDPVFDDALRQGLEAKLQQSPFLSLVSEQKIHQTLLLMGKPDSTKLTPEIARVLCQRAGGKAYLSGVISSLGRQYVIGINAVNCETGDSLALQQVTADSKEAVLRALDSASTGLREQLGESLKSVEKLDTPIEATTPSLEALQVFSLARRTMQGNGDYAAAIPLFRRATELDPKFAMAYGLLGTCYDNLAETSLASENTEKAYDLSENVSEWEKLYIESHYYHFVTGNLEKAEQIYELFSQTYPRESVPPGNLGVVDRLLGQYEKSLAHTQEALRRMPGNSLLYASLVETYTSLNRFDEARATANRTLYQNRDMHYYLYNLAFLERNETEMSEQMAWAVGNSENENIMLHWAAEAAGYSGHLRTARELSRQASIMSDISTQSEASAYIVALAALREATVGNLQESRADAAAALRKAKGRDARYAAAMALAITGDSNASRMVVEDLRTRFPEDTLVQSNYLPTLEAQLSLNHRGLEMQAIEQLRKASRYEFGAAGTTTINTRAYPVYLRAQAYLASRQPELAVAEFQKILDRPGVVVSETIGPLSFVGLARAYVLGGDIVQAKKAYEHFFYLWKDADPEIPVLVAAKSEYAKLR